MKYFPTCVSESEVGVLAQFQVSHLEIRHFRLPWNNFSYWETRKYLNHVCVYVCMSLCLSVCLSICLCMSMRGLSVSVCVVCVH